MPSANRCPRCGAELPADAPQGLCPQCLLQVGMESQTDAGRMPGALGASPGDAPTASYPAAAGSPRQPIQDDAELPGPGQVFGKYHLIRKLGRGGMGAVFEAEDTESGRRVALKLLAHSLESPEARNRFFREGRLAASINHPNSVYVYGTEVIDGTPAISMEHIGGGTLQERVRREGPLPVTRAVDVILQIIDGLEAAEKVGVLHRDVKPSNCFVDVDGTVKVGDFGLSISTAARSEGQVTQAGTFLGTPAFSSPEQLRGDELDVRSDIYAVGVTLYYLLTGRAPYDADNLVKLLATVLEQPPPSPRQYRKDIPQGLARVVLCCLAKQPSERFKNYAALRAALVPFNSTAPSPATLALRFVAGACDLILWTVVVGLVQVVWFRDFFEVMTNPELLRSPAVIALTIVMLVLQVFYFAVPEGLWGASPGKALLRLRVVGPDRGLIGIPRAAVRALIYLTFPNLIVWPYWILSGSAPFDPQQLSKGGVISLIPILMSYTFFVMLALLFSTARRRNGYAGLHDLATGARVILRSTYNARPALEVDRQPELAGAGQVTIGPYHVLETLENRDSQEFLLGYDTRLLRRVWIHRLPADSPPVPAARHNLGRVGRLRWINGRRTGPECWDAYEALSGKPLASLLAKPQPWSVVRYWLLDLARELSAAQTDGSLPALLALDRVWITADGRAKLMDFPAPGTQSRSGASQASATDDANALAPQQFLLQVAASALNGRAARSDVVDAGAAGARLPIEAHALLDRLPTVESLDPIADELGRLVRQRPSVTRLRRVAMLAATAAVPLLLATFMVLSMFMFAQIAAGSPEIAKLRNCLFYLQAQQRQPGQTNDPTTQKLLDANRQAIETYIAGNFRDVISDSKKWNSIPVLTIPKNFRESAERIVAERPQPTEEELRKAAAIVDPMLARLNNPRQVGRFAMLFAMLVGMWIMFVTIPGLLAAIAFRRGLILRSFGVDCVTRTGARASRLRMLWRAIVFNLPVVLAVILFSLLTPVVRDGTASAALLPAVGLMLALVAWSTMLRDRGLPDRLAGTYLVPG